MINTIRSIKTFITRGLQQANPFSLSPAQQLQLAADIVPFGIWEYHLSSGHIIWNRSLYKLFGIEKESFNHTLLSFKDMVHPDDKNYIEEIIQDAIHLPPADQKCYSYRVIMPDKSIRFIQANVRVIRNKKNQPVKLTGACIDITAQKAVESQIKQEKEKAELYLDSTEAMIVVLNNDAIITLINKAGSKITGYAEHELLNNNWYDILSPTGQKARLKEDFAKIVTGQAIYPEYYEREIIARSGAIKWIAWRNKLLRDENGNTTGILATGTDITDRVNAEKESESMRKMYKDIFENSVTPMLICDSYLRYKDVNPAACQMLGYSKEELLRMNVLQLTRQDRQIETLLRWTDFISTKYQTGVIELFKKDGTKIIVEYQATSEFTSGMHLSSMTDITDKKIAERKLMEQNEQLRKIAWMQSHEVRKPLANIIGLLALVDMKKLEDKNEHVFQYLKQSSDELDQIIHDIIQKTRAVNA